VIIAGMRSSMVAAEIAAAIGCAFIDFDGALRRFQRGRAAHGSVL
jgi:hypothetical protein